ncbi:Protein kinase-like domain containing protein [Amanita muscaria]
MKIRSITDAQNLVELIFCLNKNECFKSWFGVVADNATRLAVAIYGRVPLLPRSLFLNSADLDRDEETYQGKAVKICNPSASFKQKCFDAYMWGSLSHGNMGPLLGICSFQWHLVEVFALPDSSAVDAWRRSINPSVSKIQQIFFEIAKAIQYIHSLGIMLSYPFDQRDVYLDSDNHVKLQCPGFCPSYTYKEQFDYDGHDDSTYTLDDDIFWLGAFFYEILFNSSFAFQALFHEDDDDDEVIFNIRLSEPEIPDNVWQLIQRCCTKDPKERPTMDQVVQEMESWISIGQFTLS